MNKAIDIYPMLRDIIAGFAIEDRRLKILPNQLEPTLLLTDLGLDIVSLPEIVDELQSRLNGKDLGLDSIYSPETLNSMTIGQFVERVELALKSGSRNPLIVYVDDEEENLFVFKRKFGKKLELKTFTDPIEALAFIRISPDVRLVITDEVMPKMGGNELCDEVHKVKPNMKFILITGNPNNDGDLLYKTLRQNRFFEFINKPVDFEGKGEEYLGMIQGLVSFDW